MVKLPAWKQQDGGRHALGRPPGEEAPRSRAALAAQADEGARPIGSFRVRPTLRSAIAGGAGIEPQLLSTYASPARALREEAKRTRSIQVSETQKLYHRNQCMELVDVGYWEVMRAIRCVQYLAAGGNPCSYVLRLFDVGA